jgi:Trk K+ transport system NAD-binding subunit
MTITRKSLIQIGFWTVSILIVLIIGIYYFPKEDPDLKFWGAFYYTIRVFILEHDMDHFPYSPALVFIYFFAPVIALSAVGTAISYLFRFSPAIRTRWWSDHVIICGMGRTGKLLAATLKGKGVRLVGVDNAASDCLDEWCEKHKVPIIQGNFLSPKILERAGAFRARTLIFASGNDLANLEGVVAAYNQLRGSDSSPRLLWAHIANERLAKTAREALQTEGSLSIRLFDTYRISAKRMIDRHFNREIRNGVSEIDILGFGKFGRDLMEILVRDAAPDEKCTIRDAASNLKWTIRVVDVRDVGEEVKALAHDLAQALDLDVQDQVFFTQSAIQNLHLTDSEQRAFFICTDDDIGNLAAALMLAGKSTCTHIYIRMATWPMAAIADHLNQKHGMTFININDLVVQGIEDLPGIFSPPVAEDLKRTREQASASP